MRQEIDIEKWDRKEHFKYYSNNSDYLKKARKTGQITG